MRFWRQVKNSDAAPTRKNRTEAQGVALFQNVTASIMTTPKIIIANCRLATGLARCMRTCCQPEMATTAMNMVLVMKGET